MNRQTLQKIRQLASFVFEDNTYTRFINFINSRSYGKARILLERTMIDLESISDQISIILLKKADELENLVMELIIDEMEDERKQIKHITR